MIKVSMFKRITRGAAFLTKRIGKDWQSKIDINKLDINLPQSCMLGQTDSDFFKHQRKLKISDLQCAQYGFIAYNTLGPDGRIVTDGSYIKHVLSTAEHVQLTKGWKSYLSLLRLG